MDRCVSVKCPYCGREVVARIENDYKAKVIVTCDKRERGCGKDFVVSAVIQIETKAMKIEGE